MTGVEEAAVIGALAPEISGAVGSGALLGGAELGGLGASLGVDAALGSIAPEVVGAGLGSSLGGGLAAEAMGGGSSLLGAGGFGVAGDAYMPGMLSGVTGLGQTGALPWLTGRSAAGDAYMPAALSGFAGQPGTVPTSALGEAGQAADVSRGGWQLSGKNAMRIGQLLSGMGGQPQQQGGPQGSSYEPPSMRSALQTQEQITKKWLLKNDPNTYRRIYGEPQGG